MTILTAGDFSVMSFSNAKEFKVQSVGVAYTFFTKHFALQKITCSKCKNIFFSHEKYAR